MQAESRARKTGSPALTHFARHHLRTFRSAEAAEQYAYPRPQLARLERNGVLHRPAHGYYVVVPQEQVGVPWLPALEAVAAGIGAADFSQGNAILMGISAARLHGAIPRALATAVVAVPRQRGRVKLRDRNGVIIFVKRATDRLDAETLTTELGRALVTSVEQTVLDLAHRPTLGDAEHEVQTAIRSLLRRCDQDRLSELATAQRLRAALNRARAMV